MKTSHIIMDLLRKELFKEAVSVGKQFLENNKLNLEVTEKNIFGLAAKISYFEEGLNSLKEVIR